MSECDSQRTMKSLTSIHLRVDHLVRIQHRAQRGRWVSPCLVDLGRVEAVSRLSWSLLCWWSSVERQFVPCFVRNIAYCSALWAGKRGEASEMGGDTGGVWNIETKVPGLQL